MEFNLYENGIKNTIPSKIININEFLELIKKENPLVEIIRKEKDKVKRDKLKQGLSYVTIAGIFNKRKNEELIKGSGLACFDLDDIENLEEIKQLVIQNEYTHCLFVSPSGKGFKFIVKIPEIKSNEEYKQYWISIFKYYNLPEGDEGTKDVNRACYMSVDTKPYFNLNSKIYTDKVENINIIINPKKKKVKKIKKDYTPKKTDSNDFLDKLKSSISMERVLSHFGVDTSMNPTNCIFHDCSQRCLSFNSEVAHCFDSDCSDKGWNIFSFVKKVKGCDSSEAIGWLAEFAGMEKEFQESKEQYLSRNKKPMGWALSVNIRKFAERRGMLKCKICNTPFKFNTILGRFNCECEKGGLKDFAKLCLMSSSKNIERGLK